MWSRPDRVAMIVVGALALSSAPADAQSSWTAPRTPAGHPDLQAVWTNETITPFERPSSMAGKAVLTAEEAAGIEAQIADYRAASAANPRPGRVGAYNQFWMDAGTQVLKTRQTSLVVDPPDGRVPARPTAEATRDHNRAHAGESYEYMSVWDRCISRGVPGSMFPAAYNNAYRFLQVPGYVVIVHEMIHDVRIIPLDGRAHVHPNITLWMGDSRGRWEGDTLVVETTNYNDRGWIATNAASGRVKGLPVSEQLRVVEQFTRVDADTLNYAVTITDPEAYARPWTVAMPMTRRLEYMMFEYACHEGNWAVTNILSGARAEEQSALPR